MSPAKKPTKKKLKDMTNAEMAKSIFHPDVLHHVKKEITPPPSHKKKPTP
ncbi:MAG: hypothetical protein AAB011_00600 [Candidatus Eisenbacteria bacterium]